MRGVLPASELFQDELGAAAASAGVVFDLQQHEGAWLTPQACDELRSRAATVHPSPVVARCDLSDRFGPADHKELTGRLTAELLSAIQFAERVGATDLWMTTLRAGDPSANAAAIPYADALNAVYSSLCQTHRSAEVAGLRLAVAAAMHRFLLSPAECRDLIDEINANNVGVLLDLDAVSAVGDASDWIDTLRHRLRGVRFGQPDERNGSRIVHTLRQVRFDGPIVFDRAADMQRWLGDATADAVDSFGTRQLSVR